MLPEEKLGAALWRFDEPQGEFLSDHLPQATGQMIKKLKSTCRSFSRRMQTMIIMHRPYAE